MAKTARAFTVPTPAQLEQWRSMMNLWAEQKRKAEAARATVDAALAANAAGQGPGPTGEAIRNAEDWERVAAEHLRAADEFWRSVQRWGEPARR